MVTVALEDEKAQSVQGPHQSLWDLANEHQPSETQEIFAVSKLLSLAACYDNAKGLRTKDSWIFGEGGHE